MIYREFLISIKLTIIIIVIFIIFSENGQIFAFASSDLSIGVVSAKTLAVSF